MRVLLFVPIACFALAAIAVALRLLLLARRTRRSPELCAGLGLLLTCLVGHPFCAVGRLPAFIGTPFGDGLFTLGMLITASGILLLYAFTWRTFHPRSRAAAAFVLAMGAVTIWQCIGLQRATAGMIDIEQILPVTGPYAISITLLVGGAFAWTAAEALLYWRRLRRRLALGLADPVVANRLLLWGISGVVVVVMCVQVAVLAARGAMVLHDPTALLATAAAGLIISSAWWLTFLPPDRYLAWVRRRAEARAS